MKKASTALSTLLLLGGACAFAQSPANPSDYTQTSSFSYFGNGALKSSTIEPNQAQICTTTVYAYDAQGNSSSMTTSNCTGASGNALFVARAPAATFNARSSVAITVNGASKNVVVAAGVVQDSASDGLGNTTSFDVDPRFGLAIKQTDPNGSSISTAFDDFGRRVQEAYPDGTSMRVAYCVLSGRGLDVSSNSAECSGLSTADAPADATSLEYREPRNRSNAKMGAAVRDYRDRLGRLVRESRESFDGPNQPATLTSSLVVQDVVFNVFGAKVLETGAYFLATGSSTTQGANAVPVSMTVYDVLGRPTGVYQTDPLGGQTMVLGNSSSTVAYGIYGTRHVSQTTFSYQGLATGRTNDKGQSILTERDPLLYVSRVTDATGAQVSYQSDAFGNVVATRDALQNTIRQTYDFRGRRVQVQDPDRGLMKFAYSANGNLVSSETPNQRSAATITTMQYDALDRMIKRSEPEFITNWYFDKYADGSACTYGVGALCESTTSSGLRRRNVYDSAEHLVSTRSDVSGGTSFAAARIFDSATGRLATHVYPTGISVNYGYTPRGYAVNLNLGTSLTLTPKPASVGGAAGPTVSLPSVTTVLWQRDAVSASGESERTTLSSGVVNSRTRDPLTGRTTAISAGPAGSRSVMDLGVAWDTVGNVSSRSDNLGDGSSSAPAAVSESFAYDGLNRLVQYDVSGPRVSDLTRSVKLQYNALGMLLSKTDVGNYAYSASGASSVQPHRVNSVFGASPASYSSDADGNIVGATNGKYRSVSYTSFELPDSQSGVGGSGGQLRYTWLYDERHARFQEKRFIASGTMAGTRTISYLHPDNAGGLSFESETDAPTAASASNPVAINNRHFLSVNGEMVGVLVTAQALPTLSASQLAPTRMSAAPAVELEYWHLDHLGSLAATTDHSGARTAHYAYDPFGKRRYTGGDGDAFGRVVADWSPVVNSGTARGFTGHEGLDDIGIVHMNGRLFDPTLGLFLEADPMISMPENLQSYNRYAYLTNNPLNGVDPTGFQGETSEPGFTEAISQFVKTISLLFSKPSNSVASISGGANAQAPAAVATQRVVITGYKSDPATQTFNGKPMETPQAAGSGLLVAGMGSIALSPAAQGIRLPPITLRLLGRAAIGGLIGLAGTRNPAGAVAGIVLGASLTGDTQKADDEPAPAANGDANDKAGTPSPPMADTKGTPEDPNEKDLLKKRADAKAAMYATKKAPQLKEIFGWGNDIEGAQAARAALDDQVMARIQGSITRAEVEAARDLYRANELLGKAGDVAPVRAAYMEDILARWK